MLLSFSSSARKRDRETDRQIDRERDRERGRRREGEREREGGKHIGNERWSLAERRHLFLSVVNIPGERLFLRDPIHCSN